MPQLSRLILFAAVAVAVLPPSRADQAKILTNHVGYEADGPKHAVIQASATDKFKSCVLTDPDDHRQTFLTIAPQHVGPVEKWREWDYWTIDFDSFATEGTYVLQCVFDESDRIRIDRGIRVVV